MPEEINRLAADQLAELFIDPGLKIDWQLSSPPTICAKDRLGLSFREAEVFA
jgi:hypothetical protein